MNHQRQTVREAAILIACLEDNLADRLLGRLSSTEAARLRQAMARLGNVEPAEQQTLVVQFRRARAGVQHPPDTGVVLEGALADQGERVFADRQAESGPPPAASGERPFRFLSDADPHALIPFLRREHGQTAAVVLSHLPPEQAAQVLAALPAAMQVDVVKRLANLDTADEESLRVIARELETWMDQQRQHGRRRAAGLQAVSGILAAASPAEQQAVVANLHAADRDLARQVTRATSTRAAPSIDGPEPARPSAQTIDFDDLSALSGDHLAALAAAAEPEIVVLALTGASDRLTTRLLGALPPQLAAVIRQRLSQIGPIRLSDVEAAQQELAKLAAETDGQSRTRQSPRLDAIAA